MSRVLHRLGFPSVGDHRRFVTAIAVDAVGSGVFMPVCVLYFLVTTDLSLVQVGRAISLASAVALPAGPLLGGVVDRYGAKHVLLAGNALQALGFVAYLVTDSFVGADAVDGRGDRRPDRVLGLLRQHRRRDLGAGGAGEVVRLPRRAAQRRASRSAGCSPASRSRSAPPTAYAAVVVANAASYVLAFVLLLAVPPTPRGRPPQPPRAPGAWCCATGPTGCCGPPSWRSRPR